MAKYKHKSNGAIVDAVQWQPGVEHPAVVREYPADRGHRQGWAEAGRGVEISPGTWLVELEDEYLPVGAEAFANQYEFAPDENPPPTRTCWVAKFAGVLDAPCGEDCAALLPGGCGLLAALGVVAMGGE